MKISVKNLGPVKEAEFELGDFTIICGRNNTGKTYAAYALYGFLLFWDEAFTITIPGGEKKMETLMAEGSIDIDLDLFHENRSKILLEASNHFTAMLPRVFASEQDKFNDTSFIINSDSSPDYIGLEFNQSFGTSKKRLIRIHKDENSGIMHVSIIGEVNEIYENDPELILNIISDAIKKVVFGKNLPTPFIASAERTGAAIFRKELNFARNRLLEEVSTMERELNPFDLIGKVYLDYALPVKRNVDFTRQLEEVSKGKGFLFEKYNYILEDFSDIIGGSYKVMRDNELYFVPDCNKRLKLSMDESSSSVRSMFDIGFYLKHEANYGDLLIIDEPELNLHPENQRRVARLLATLANAGIKIFITTHSDYIIKELNTLIMLNSSQNEKTKENIKSKYKYRNYETISFDKIKVYMAKKRLIHLNGNKKRTRAQSLVEADVDKFLGIQAQSFDETIDEMNRIQRDLIFGD